MPGSELKSVSRSVSVYSESVSRETVDVSVKITGECDASRSVPIITLLCCLQDDMQSAHTAVMNLRIRAFTVLIYIHPVGRETYHLQPADARKRLADLYINNVK